MSNNVEPKKCLWVIEVLHFELFSKEIEDFVTCFFVWVKYKNIVDIDNEDYIACRRVVDDGVII